VIIFYVGVSYFVLPLPSLMYLDLYLLLGGAAVNIESEGPYAPERLLPEAIKVMREKIARIKKAAEALLDGGEAAAVGEDVEMADA
jgi:hypothetical protein